MPEASEFLDFLVFKHNQQKAKSSLDMASREAENGKAEVFKDTLIKTLKRRNSE